jgi:hypothetical protein
VESVCDPLPGWSFIQFIDDHDPGIADRDIEKLNREVILPWMPTIITQISRLIIKEMEPTDRLLLTPQI